MGWWGAEGGARTKQLYLDLWGGLLPPDALQSVGLRRGRDIAVYFPFCLCEAYETVSHYCYF